MAPPIHIGSIVAQHAGRDALGQLLQGIANNPTVNTGEDGILSTQDRLWLTPAEVAAVFDHPEHPLHPQLTHLIATRFPQVKNASQFFDAAVDYLRTFGHPFRNDAGRELHRLAGRLKDALRKGWGKSPTSKESEHVELRWEAFVKTARELAGPLPDVVTKELFAMMGDSGFYSVVDRLALFAEATELFTTDDQWFHAIDQLRPIEERMRLTNNWQPERDSHGQGREVFSIAIRNIGNFATMTESTRTYLRTLLHTGKGVVQIRAALTLFTAGDPEGRTRFTQMLADSNNLTWYEPDGQFGRTCNVAAAMGIEHWRSAHDLATQEILLQTARGPVSKCRQQLIGGLFEAEDIAFTPLAEELLNDPKLPIFLELQTAQFLLHKKPTHPTAIARLLAIASGSIETLMTRLGAHHEIMEATIAHAYSNYTTQRTPGQPRLLKLGIPNETDPLLDRTFELKMNALRALTDVNNPDVDVIGLQILERGFFAEVVTVAIQILGQRHTTAAIPLLCEYLFEDDPEVRLNAVSALGQMGPAARTTIPSLEKLQALHPENVDIRLAVKSALRQITAQ